MTNHNYNEFLSTCLKSIKNQILRPKEVIVVDDGSEESCEEIVKQFGFTYVRTEYQNPLKAREDGYRRTTSDFVCFVDADDKIPEGYLKVAASAIVNEYDIIISDTVEFGDSNKTTSLSSEIQPKRLWQVNFMHVGCLVSRVAIELSDAFEGHPDTADYHEDWFFWRKIVGYGFKFAKQEAKYHVRKHGRNRSTKIEKSGYLSSRAVHSSTIFEIAHGNISEKKTLQLLNVAARKDNSDYVYIGAKQGTEKIPQLMSELGPNVGMVQHSNYKQFGCTLLVGPVLRSYIFKSLKELPLDPKLERIVKI